MATQEPRPPGTSRKPQRPLKPQDLKTLNGRANSIIQYVQTSSRLGQGERDLGIPVAGLLHTKCSFTGAIMFFRADSAVLYIFPQKDSTEARHPRQYSDASFRLRAVGMPGMRAGWGFGSSLARGRQSCPSCPAEEEAEEEEEEE